MFVCLVVCVCFFIMLVGGLGLSLRKWFKKVFDGGVDVGAADIVYCIVTDCVDDWIVFDEELK